LERFLEDARESYMGLKLREIKHRFVYKKYSKRMAQGLERYMASKVKKPHVQIRREIRLCKAVWGCYPLHYYRYDLYQKNKEMGDGELTDYIPEFFFYHLFLPFHDSGEYDIVLNDKNLMELVFRSLHIPQPETVFKLIRNRLFTKELKEIAHDAMEGMLKNCKYRKIFLKPVDGDGGHGIFIFHRNDMGEYIPNNGTVLDTCFLQRIGSEKDYIAQAGVEQTRELMEIYPCSVNTFRLVTENKDGMVRSLCAILRMGRDGREVDNASQDGLFIRIDMDTGELGDWAYNEIMECFSHHPDTNIPFQGRCIPRWSDIKAFVETCAGKLSQFTYLGWDIALEEEGPLALEVNRSFGLDLLQIALGGLREVFGIEDPAFYWRNRGER
jgi:hypothetical protein